MFMDEEDKKMEKIEGEIFGNENVIRIRGARQNNLKNIDEVGFKSMH
jgi:excinuclease UvrABC ATPase subunit